MLIDEFAKNNKSSLVVAFSNQVKSLIIEEESNNQKEEELIEKFFSTKDGVDKVFSHRNKNRAKGNAKTFVRRKKCLTTFLHWLRDNNICKVNDEVLNYAESYKYEDTLNDELFISYFKNLNDVLDYIDLIGSTKFAEAKKENKKVKNYDKNNDLLLVKSACIIYWYGFSMIEMSYMNKDCIVESGKKYYIVYDNNKVPIRENEYQILKRLRDAKGEYVLSRPINFNKFNDGERLFRTRKKTNLSACNLSESGTSKILERFNFVVIQMNAPKVLNGTALKTNAMFVDVLTFASPTKKGTRKYMRENYSSDVASNYHPLFIKWAKLFHNIDII